MVGNGAARRLVRLRRVDSNFKCTGRVRFASGSHVTQLRGDICVTNLIKADNVEGPRVRTLSQYLAMERHAKIGIIAKEGLPPKPRRGDDDRKDMTTKMVGITEPAATTGLYGQAVAWD
jgi:hypothetical protein